MNTAVETVSVVTLTCGNGNLIRIWVDDTVTNVQLTSPVCVEYGRARFDGQDAAAHAALVTEAWRASNV